MRRQWTPDERTWMIDRYESLGATAIAHELRRSPDSVSSQARRHGLGSRDYRKRQGRTRAARSPSVNTRFFETATPETAFVLGYIWGSGSIKTKHRRVLRASCARGALDGLRKVRALLGSHHLIQTYENNHVLEICNSRVVETLVEKFGRPPGRMRDGEPPRLAEGLLSRFAAGHLLATGSRNDIHVRWVGHPSVITWLGSQIASQARVPPANCVATTARVSIRWNNPSHLHAIGEWLDHVD